MDKRRSSRRKWIIGAVSAVVLIGLAGGIAVFGGVFKQKPVLPEPGQLLSEYVSHIEAKEYGKMYQMIDVPSSLNITETDFVERNSNIYEGIEVQNIKLEIIEDDPEEAEDGNVSYRMQFDTAAGAVNFEHQAFFAESEEGWRLIWSDSMIFPALQADDKVRISTSEAQRGEILDRNGQMLAGAGNASSVGIVPGKLEDRDKSLETIAELLEMDKEAVEQKLTASWVKDDSFVPIKTLPSIEDVKFISALPGPDMVSEVARQEQLLEIPGVMISDIEVRSYPLGQAAAHLIGYVQNVTAEDLEEHPDEDYSAGSVIGRSGMEGLYEKELKGKNGRMLFIEDKDGEMKELLASQTKEDGQDIQLTIDAAVQVTLYEQFQEDKSTSVAMNPKTGEVLALVSTPAFDNNDFILGMSDQTWTDLNENEDKPLYNRFRQVWSPGSVLKPVIAAIGLDSGAIDPKEDYGSEGLSWQKDTSWGSYHVTTLHDYQPVILENALIYSDNIYFAKAALKIGAERLTAGFDQLGFNQELPFEIAVSDSQYSNSDTIESEVQLADSGYGQGEILMNPVHLASLYTLFVNNGDVIKPYLQYREQPEAEVWIPSAFSQEITEEVLTGMEKVVNDPNGTGYGARSETIALAGKTGTAEIKATQEDTSGTELGWFAVFTTDPAIDTPFLLVSMVEDVKEIGGSGYVVDKAKAVLDDYFYQ